MKVPVSPHLSLHWVLLFYYFIILKLGAKAVGNVRKQCPPWLLSLAFLCEKLGAALGD